MDATVDRLVFVGPEHTALSSVPSVAEKRREPRSPTQLLHRPRWMGPDRRSSARHPALVRLTSLGLIGGTQR